MAGLGAAALATLLVFAGLPGCENPVDEDITLTITGRVLLPDGTPATGLLVHVQKSDYDAISFDWAIGTLINEDVEPFRSATTDSDGRFYFSFTGKEANAGSGLWAAYFKVWSTKGDGEQPMAVATPAFTFTNSQPDREVPDMRFIQFTADNVVYDTTSQTLKVTWEREALPDTLNKIVVQMGASDWVAEADDEGFELPLAALEPCLASVEAGTCTPLPGDTVRITVLTDDLMYRTNWQAFLGANPKGTGINYSSADDDSSGATCTGLPLYKLNDGKNDPMLVSDFAKNASQEDVRCLQFDLKQAYDLSWFFLHGGLMLEHKQVTVRISTSTQETPNDASFTEWGRFSLANNQFWHVNLQLLGPRAGARWVRVELDGPADKQLWFALGEITLY